MLISKHGYAMNINGANQEIEIEIGQIRRLCTHLLRKGLSLSAPQARALFDQFLYAELSGKRTHGLIRIPWLLKKRRGHSSPRLLKTAASISRFACAKSIGYLAANEITDYLQKRSPQEAFHLAVAQDISPTGVLGYYVRRLLRGNFVMVFGAASDLVRVASSTQKLFGTNPFAAGLSYGKNRQFLMDTTTAQASFGEVLAATYGIKPFDQTKYRTADNAVPQVVNDLFNEQAQFTGAILQRLQEQSDFRQYALMLLIQCVTTLISQQTIKTGDVVFLIVRKRFFGTKNVAEAMLRTIEEHVGPDLIPGMHSARLYAANRKRKTVLIPKKLWDELMQLRSA